jgi:cell division protease FtsH
LENLLNEAAIFAARRDQRTIGNLEFQDAFDRIALGPEKKSHVMSQEDKETVAYHEAGHAVVSFHLANTDPIQKITIVPRGRAGGYVLPLREERMVYTREKFEDQIAMAMGGRAAEEVFFGQITTGAASDLQQSTRWARAMVMNYGMSSSLGLPTYGDQHSNPFVGRDYGFGGGRDYSEEAAKAIDDEVRMILDHNYKRAKQIIEENRNKMVALANALLEVETMDRKTFEKLMNDTLPVDSENGTPGVEELKDALVEEVMPSSD